MYRKSHNALIRFLHFLYVSLANLANHNHHNEKSSFQKPSTSANQSRNNHYKAALKYHELCLFLNHKTYHKESASQYHYSL